MEKINLLRSVLCGALIVVFLCGCGNDTAKYVSAESMQETQGSEAAEESVVTTETSTDTEEVSIYVYVCGAVHSPGVYTLPEGSRVFDAFYMAGGLTKDAAQDYWNQASLLKDGEMIYVPTIEQASERTWDEVEDVFQESSATGKVNINTASKEILMTIPGIGEAKANAIISYREKNGGFSSVEEVKEVEGIKDGVYTKMKEYIVIN